jgi:hypothetical protein
MNSRHPLPAAELVENLLGEGLEVRLQVSGSSMKPFVRSGSILRFSAAPRPCVGDVVLTRHPNDALVAHRVIAIEGDWILTKGDSCGAADAPVPKRQVLGSALRLERGRFSLPMRNPLVRCLGLALNRIYPVLVLAYRSLVPRKRSSSC